MTILIHCRHLLPPLPTQDDLYDKNSNLIYSQDANQRGVNIQKYTFRNYDGLNRLTGLGEELFHHDNPYDGIQYAPSSADKYLTVNVYDTISQALISNFFNGVSGYDDVLNFSKGNLAATAYRTINTDPWNFKYYRYDERGRVKKMWNVLAGFDTLITDYYYNSQDQITFYSHSGKGEAKTFRNTYDYAGRLWKVDYYTGAPDAPDPFYLNLVEYVYNENSQVLTGLYNDGTIKNDFSYTNRNWIKYMQNSGEMFGYTNTYFKNGNVKSQELAGSYNDNFAKTDELTFNYSYERSNRLLLAVKAGGSSFRVENSYDSAGNITMLKRYNGDGNIIDDFTYSYNSGTNKLRKVTGSADQYSYDNNGNMTRDDLNKNTGIKYDHRNLITELRHKTFETDTVIYFTFYSYDESGNRFAKTVYKTDTDLNPPDTISQGDMISSGEWVLYNQEFYSRDVSGRELAIYKNDELEEYPLYGLDLIGKLKNDLTYFYHIDHLGSVRAVVNADNELVSSQDYDPWGYILQDRTFESDSSKFKFTSKERDVESKYDYFGARYYDARIGRWGSVDPLLEKHFDFTVYNYALDNPLFYIDPDGKQIAFPVWDAIKYTFVKTAETVAPLAGVPISPIGIAIGSLVNPSQLGQIEKYNEFIAEQRLLIDELNPRYTTEEIVVTALMSEGDMRKLDDKEAKEYAQELGYTGEKSVEKLKEQALKEEGIAKERAGSFDVYKDKSTGKHYLKPKPKFEKQFKNKNIPLE